MEKIEKIELVIKIPLEEYRLILLSDRTAMANCASKECMMYAIKNGTPLPKGHGDLIDKNNLITITDISADCREITYVSYSEIENAPTIIEADISGKEIER